ncbi:polysaccharide deacetylase family protein [Thioalkalivibrio thiocyanoxidans]|uniref:polysaccharide deacetylase family protein n=1 Tax=Thioalkalivibrio thiocyanoxidans TaxID=152475 RepID=UPI000378DB45|nr:polysaccharide deacetylase family protein [Thioalkalivibrio thiocyanoxidans]
MTTRVHLTVDTEFSIAGAFREPQTHQPVGPPSVYCHRNGRSEGLGYLLDTLDRYAIRATFFVETLNTIYFGDEPMGEIAHEIAGRAHDIQLHLHPCWTYFGHPDWVQRLQSDPPNDNVTRRSVEELADLIDQGRATFRRWGLDAPSVLRTGGLKVDLKVYAAMRQAGLPRASNIGLAIYPPAEPELQLRGGCHVIDGVLEFPVTTYTDFRWGPRAHLKSLTITGTSWPEMRRLLFQARRQGLSDVVVLTHPFEFVRYRDEQQAPSINPLTRRRLERLCRFLRSEPGFTPACMADVLATPAPREVTPTLTVPAAQAALRALENWTSQRVFWG